MFLSTKRPSGFSLLEIVVSIGLFALLAALVVFPLISFRNASVLSGETSKVLSLINKARSNTLASKDLSEYGVHIQSDRVVFFVGTAYSSSAPTNEVYMLHPSIGINTISLTGGGADIIFDRLTGETAEYGSFHVYLLSDATKQNTITISQTGISRQN